MKKLVFCLALLSVVCADAQTRREDIYTDFVVYGKRQRLFKDLQENTIGGTFSRTLTKENEHRFESACWATAQFQFRNAVVFSGLQKMAASYDSLEYDTRRAFLEATYAVYPEAFTDTLFSILHRERDPKLFAMCAVQLYRQKPDTERRNELLIAMVENFPEYESHPLLLALQDHLNQYGNIPSLPSVKELSQHFRKLGLKVIFSFQRWNRDYPGLAIVQNSDGSWVKRADGRLMVFEQLARSGSALPYFITNGNTPQGIFAITGTAVAHNQFIGPTPNLQMIMPFEDSLQKFYHHLPSLQNDTAALYQSLLPPGWKNYGPVWESYRAGKIGRTEIIAHGTTIDPEYFKDKPYYPLTPTLGCLCAKELWNVTSGRLLVSEQFNLYSAFTATAGQKGFLVVINIDQQNRAVTREDIEQLLK